MQDSDLRLSVRTVYHTGPQTKATTMGINSESDLSADLQIGPTTDGGVRIFVKREDTEIPMDFDPDEAEEIADELRAAAAVARKASKRRS